MIDIFIIVGGTLFLMFTFLYLHFAYCKYKSPFLNNGDFKEYLTSFYNTIVKGE